MDRIRSGTRSIGMDIGMVPPWKGSSSEESMYRAAGALNANAPGRGAFLHVERGSSRTGGMDFVSSLLHAPAPQARS